MTLRRLAAIACALVLVAALLPGGGPALPAVLPDAPSFAAPLGGRADAAEVGGAGPRDGAVTLRSGRAPPAA